MSDLSTRPLRVLPVLDLLGGQVVRGVAGEREKYRPLTSELTTSTDPIAVARAFRAILGLHALYLADLDAILHSRPNSAIYEALLDDGFTLWLDAGVRNLADALRFVDMGVQSVVVGLETIASRADLADIVAELPNRIVFSLDLRAGAPLSHPAGWESADVWAIACDAVEMGVRTILLLDLARVGVGKGTGTEELCTRLAGLFPGVEIAAGGGIRHRPDLLCLRRCGASTILVATALHTRAITSDDLQDL